MMMKEALQKIKDEMLRPEYEKRRHLGCSICGHTFYGRYQKKGLRAVPNGITTPSRREGWTTVHTHSDIFYPDCPKCFDDLFVCEAKKAIASYNHQKEKSLKKQEAARKRQEKRDSKPRNCGNGLFFETTTLFKQRLSEVASNPDLIKPIELLNSYFLDELFIKKFGLGRFSMMCGHYKVTKRLYDGTYKSNSGKTRMGYFTPYFDVVNTNTGKEREIGTEDVREHINLERKYGTNRRNDPDRNFGLPNSRGYK